MVKTMREEEMLRIMRGLGRTRSKLLCPVGKGWEGNGSL